MPWVAEEEIQAARNMTAYEYLRTHHAQRLQKTRTRNEWQLTDHDSCLLYTSEAMSKESYGKSQKRVRRVWIFMKDSQVFMGKNRFG